MIGNASDEPEDKSFQLFCGMVQCKPVPPFDVKASDTIENVKAKIQEVTGVPMDSATLSKNGKVMEDDKQLRHYGINQGNNNITTKEL